MLSLRPSQSLSFTTKYSSDKQNDSTTDEQNDNRIIYPPPPPPAPQQSEKKSFAVATGELFLGIASRVLRRGNKISSSNNNGNVDYEERIGAVMEDDVEPGVIWEQRVKDIEAEKERPVITSPGFSFSAAGLLFPYHLGVAHLLIEKGYIKETTPLAGSSAGAIVCAVVASGASMHEALTVTKVLAEDCRLNGTAFRLGNVVVICIAYTYIRASFLINLAVLRDVLEKFLPDDVHIRSSGRVRVLSVLRLAWVEVHLDPCAVPAYWVVTGVIVEWYLVWMCGALMEDVDSILAEPSDILHPWTPALSFRTGVAVTQILWRPRGLLVDQFDSKEDLINAVVTSSFIPGYLAPRPATMFRNRLCIDGGLTLFMPPTSAAKTVRVCAFPASRMGLQGIGISPDCNPENRASPRELFNWALEPAEDHILDRLFELGYLDAAVWAEENPVQNVVQDDSTLVENGSSSSP
ncbi:unnamed protein product [Dovyalis caffra]|uniref:Patatin n=1 Tax=Dovyalis caffra TaxID=77055 RepID=A0AAV1SW88_9ROSI|nr:unnamed protein product [Dovyalis caffra]